MAVGYWVMLIKLHFQLESEVALWQFLQGRLPWLSGTGQGNVIFLY